MPLDSSVSIPLPDGGNITDELITLNSMVSMSQKGVDPLDTSTAEIWSARLSAILNDRYKVEITPTFAWLIADAVVGKLKEMQANFTQGLKSRHSTGSTLVG